jgi:hypothetical protein
MGLQAAQTAFQFTQAFTGTAAARKVGNGLDA